MPPKRRTSTTTSSSETTKKSRSAFAKANAEDEGLSTSSSSGETESKKPERVIPECFRGKDYYEILGVAKDASNEDINKAYKRMSLKHHPDRNDSPTATEEFQHLARIHETLTKDPRKRALYDKHGDGIVDDASTEFMDAYDYWREVFPELQTGDVEAFKETYVGSEEEKEDVTNAFKEAKGDMFVMIQQLIFFADSTTVDRHVQLVRDLVKEGRIKTKNLAPTFEKSLVGLKERLEKFEKEEETKVQEVEKAKAAAKAKSSKGADASLNAVFELIKSNAASRENFLDMLAAKYEELGAGSKRAGKSAAAKSGAAKSGAAKNAKGGKR